MNLISLSNTESLFIPIPSMDEETEAQRGWVTHFARQAYTGTEM